MNAVNGHVSRFAAVLSAALLALALVAALLLSAGSVFHSYVLDPAHYASQHLYQIDENEITNIAAVAAGALILRWADKRWRISSRALFVCACTLLFLYAAAGIVWVLSTHAIPNSDQGILLNSARLLILRDIKPFSTIGDPLHFYYVRFPFQFGALGYMEGLMRLVGYDALLKVAPALNVVYLVAGDAAILLSVQRQFSDNNVTLLALLFLCTGLQPLFGCSLVYGTYPAFMLSMWAVYLVIRYLQDGGGWRVGLSAALLALAVLLKANAWIVVVALAIILCLHAFDRRRWLPAVWALLLCAAAMPLPKFVQASYESRVGASYGAGMPKTSWMAMSTQNSAMAAGWYSTYSWHLYERSGGDLAVCVELSRQDLKNKIHAFAADPMRARAFYSEKLYSQWNENTFQSVWTSRVCETVREPGALVRAVYEGALKAPLEFICNQYVQFLYAGFLLGVLALFWSMRGQSERERLIFPTVLLGAVLFHFLFEAKSQYVLTYLPQFAPVAAFGVLRAFRRAETNRS